MNEEGHTFDKEVLNYVRYSRKIDDSILNDQLIKSYDHYGSLLHHAVRFAPFSKNTAVIQQLIDLGSDVDFVGRNSWTPFMLAVEMGCTASLAKIFLKAKANIDVVDTEGQSVLQRALATFNCDSPLIKLFVSKVKTKRTTPEALTTRLIAAGCKMFEAAAFKDIEVMQCMLRNGIGIDSSVSKYTALHRAAAWGNVEMVRWLVENGANVDAVNSISMSALHVAAKNRNEAILRILLERGANPNLEYISSGCNALKMIFDRQPRDLIVEDAVKCVKVLLQYGATFNVTLLRDRPVFKHAFDWPSIETVNMLISQLAMLNTSQSDVIDNIHSHLAEPLQLEKFYQLCLEVLETEMFENLSLLDLLNSNETRLNSMARRKTFASSVKSACLEHKLRESNGFYYDTLMMRIDKACRVVKLENKAIFVICELFGRSYNQCINFAREIVSYLKEYDLERLIQV